MRLRTIITAGLALTGWACTGKAVDAPHSGGSDTSAAEDGGDADAGGDAGSTDGGGSDSGGDGGGPDTASDTGQGPAPDPNLRLEITLPSLPSPSERAVLGLIHTTFGDGPAVRSTFASAPVSDGLTVVLTLDQAPLDSELADLGHSWPDLTGALFSLVLFEDDDGDQRLDSGERWWGLSADHHVAWLIGDGPPGSTPGWNVMDLGLSGTYDNGRCLGDTSEPLGWRDGYPVVRPPNTVIPLPLRGIAATLEVGGQATGDLGDQPRLAGLPYQFLTGGPPLTPIIDLDITGSAFSGTLTLPPPDDHDIGADPEWRHTLAALMRYTDGDTSGSWSEDDLTTNTTTCIDDLTAWLRYNREVWSWRGARMLECADTTVGWHGVTIDPGSGESAYRTPAEMGALQLDPARCAL